MDPTGPVKAPTEVSYSGISGLYGTMLQHRHITVWQAIKDSFKNSDWLGRIIRVVSLIFSPISGPLKPLRKYLFTWITDSGKQSLVDRRQAELTQLVAKTHFDKESELIKYKQVLDEYCKAIYEKLVSPKELHKISMEEFFSQMLQGLDGSLKNAPSKIKMRLAVDLYHKFVGFYSSRNTEMVQNGNISQEIRCWIKGFYELHMSKYPFPGDAQEAEKVMKQMVDQEMRITCALLEYLIDQDPCELEELEIAKKSKQAKIIRPLTERLEAGAFRLGGIAGKNTHRDAFQKGLGIRDLDLFLSDITAPGIRWHLADFFESLVVKEDTTDQQRRDAAEQCTLTANKIQLNADKKELEGIIDRIQKGAEGNYGNAEFFKSDACKALGEQRLEITREMTAHKATLVQIATNIEESIRELEFDNESYPNYPVFTALRARFAEIQSDYEKKKSAHDDELVLLAISSIDSAGERAKKLERQRDLSEKFEELEFECEVGKEEAFNNAIASLKELAGKLKKATAGLADFFIDPKIADLYLDPKIAEAGNTFKKLCEEYQKLEQEGPEIRKQFKLELAQAESGKIDGKQKAIDGQIQAIEVRQAKAALDSKVKGALYNQTMPAMLRGKDFEYAIYVGNSSDADVSSDLNPVGGAPVKTASTRSSHQLGNRDSNGLNTAATSLPRPMPIFLRPMSFRSDDDSSDTEQFFDVEEDPVDLTIAVSPDSETLPISEQTQFRDDDDEKRFEVIE